MQKVAPPSTCSPPGPPLWSRPIWAEVDLDAYAHNLRSLRSLCGVPLLCVLKADAYGHGALGLAPTAALMPRADVAMLGVASVEEGAALRSQGIALPILLLSAILPSEVPDALEHGLTPTVFTPEVARAVHSEAQKRGRAVDVHLKIDTGMRRLGVPWQQAPAFFEELRRLEFLRVAGIYTHFSCADSDAAFTERQRRRFLGALSACAIDWENRPLLHASNSAGAIGFPHARFDMVRPGIASYGLSCGLSHEALNLRPVMSLRAKITHTQQVPRGARVSYGASWRAARPSRLAVVPAGYADGYPRLASGQAQVLVGGQRAPIVGRVTMDQVIVDVTDSAARVGDTVTLWGREGSDELSADEVARWAQTIGYEVTCGVAARVRRVCVGRQGAAPREAGEVEEEAPRG